VVLDRVQAELASQLNSRLAANKGKRTPETIAMNRCQVRAASTEINALDRLWLLMA
jgi:hypothetical protein